MRSKVDNQTIKTIIYSCLGVAFLCAVVICTINIVLKLKNDQGMNDSGDMDIACLSDNFDEIVGCIEKIYQEDQDIDAFIDNYDKVIVWMKNEKEFEMAARLETERAMLLANYGYCDKAISILDNGDFSVYENKYLANIYAEAVSLALECKNEEIREKWSALMIESQNGVQYEAF